MRNKPAGYWKSDEENNSNPEEGSNFPVFVEDLQTQHAELVEASKGLVIALERIKNHDGHRHSEDTDYTASKALAAFNAKVGNIND